MRIIELQMVSHSCISVEDPLELLPLESSTSPIWKFFGFSSRDGKVLKVTRSESVFFVSCVNATIPMLEIQQIYGNIWKKAILKNIVKVKKKWSKLVNPNLDLDHEVMREAFKKGLKVNQR